MAISKKNSTGGPLGMLINHAEKIVLGSIAIVALVVLGMTSWSPYNKEPLELVTKIKVANEDVEKSIIPEEKIKEYRDLNQDDTRIKVQESFNNLPIAGKNFSNEWWKIPGKHDGEPVREPIWLTVERLIATPGKVVLAQLKALPSEIIDAGSAVDGKTPDKTDDPNAPNEFTPKAGMVPGALSETGEPLTAANNGGVEPLMPQDAGMVPEDEIGNLTSTQIVSNLEVVPVSFISIRGIFQRQKQIKLIADALHTKPEIAEQYLTFYDFVLERQESSEGPDKWKDTWIEVDKQVALEYLEKSPDWEPDVISAAIFDPVVTMSLPARLIGVWNSYVDHPDIREFALSPEEMKLEAQLNLKSLEAMKDEATKNRGQSLKAPGGFWKLQRGTRQAQDQYLNSTPTDKLLLEFEKELKQYDNDAQKAIIERIKKRASAEGNLILFRYLDFDVKPGKAYRYRVKLQLANPNFGLSAENAEKFTVVEGETRDSPWSAPTEAAAIDKDSYYFVKRVDLPRNYLEPKATFSVVEVNSSSGTLINSDIEVAVGEHIKATKKTHIIRPDKGTFESEEVVFSSENLLLDIKGIGKVDSSFHKEISFPNKFSGDIQAPSMTLVLNDAGTLEAKHPFSDYADQKRVTDKKERQDKAWEHIKDAVVNNVQATDSMEEMMMMEGGEFGSDGGFTQFGDAERQTNALRKGNKTKKPVKPAPTAKIPPASP